MSNKKQKRRSKKHGKKRERWYYDACTLDSEQDTYSQIVNKKNPPRESVISHLALGEAYANCHRKGKGVAEAFTELIESLRDFIKVVGNDRIEAELKVVQRRLVRLSFTDAVHLATALKYGCNILRTIDPDLLGIRKERLKEVVGDIGKGTITIRTVQQRKPRR